MTDTSSQPHHILHPHEVYSNPAAAYQPNSDINHAGDPRHHLYQQQQQSQQPPQAQPQPPQAGYPTMVRTSINPI